jgi:hypothetical protein
MKLDIPNIYIYLPGTCKFGAYDSRVEYELELGDSDPKSMILVYDR